jgi:hypothetical protein
MPITRKEFKKGSTNLEKEITDFLNTHKDKAFTSDELMSATSLHTEFNMTAAPKTTVLIAANFVAFINDLATKGKISRQVLNNRMYFSVVEPKRKKTTVKS